MIFDRELFEKRHGRVNSELIEVISQRHKLLDFMNRYNLTSLREATEEQLSEYIEYDRFYGE